MLARFVAAAVALSLAACAGAASSPVPGLDAADASEAPTPGAGATEHASERGTADARAPRPPAKTDLFTKTLGDPKDQPVVYVHGGPGGNGVMFEETIAPKLAGRGFFAVSYDQRGSGRSPKAEREELTLARFVADLEDVIFTLRLEKPILVGHSFGGTLALRFAEAHPDALRGVVLVAAPIDFPDSLSNVHAGCVSFYEPRFFVADELAAVKALHGRMFPNGMNGPFSFTSADVGETLKGASDCKLSWPAVSNVPGALGTWGRLMTTSPNKDLAMSVEVSVSDAIHENERLFERQLWPLLEKTKAKVWGIYGGFDGMFSEAQNERIEKTIGAERFAFIEGASHVVFVDDERAFLDAFTRHVAAMK